MRPLPGALDDTNRQGGNDDIANQRLIHRTREPSVSEAGRFPESFGTDPGSEARRGALEKCEARFGNEVDRTWKWKSTMSSWRTDSENPRPPRITLEARSRSSQSELVSLAQSIQNGGEFPCRHSLVRRVDAATRYNSGTVPGGAGLLENSDSGVSFLGRRAS
jgi:hypothetical protein